MCFSGGFALGMMVDEIMVAPVLSQPSFPMARGQGGGERQPRALARRRGGRDPARVPNGCQVLGLRFTGDRLVGTRFDTLRAKLGDAFIAVELPSRPRVTTRC